MQTLEAQSADLVVESYALIDKTSPRWPLRCAYEMMKGLWLISRERKLVRYFRYLVCMGRRCKGVLAYHIFALLRSRSLLQTLESGQDFHLHIFWGHYPSWMLIVASGSKKIVRKGMFLGAYDLDKRLYISKLAARVSDYVVTHSLYNRKRVIEFLGLPAGKVATVYRGVCVPHERQDCRTIDLIFVGRFLEVKGVREFLKIVEYCFDNNLLRNAGIAGAGIQELETLAYSLKEKYPGRFEVFGWLSHGEVYRLFERSKRIFLWSTHSGEMLPNVLKEAMVRGCLPIVNDMPGISELVVSEKNGFVVNRFDVESILEAIKVDASQKMRDEAYITISDHFNVQKTTKQLLGLISGDAHVT